MKGLLYKDFLAVKWKKYIIILISLVLALLILRIALPGTDNTVSYAMGKDGGTQGEVNDALLSVPAYVIIGLSFLIIPSKVYSTFSLDEKTKSRSYMFSLPVNKNAYVASKYILLLIILYIATSICTITSLIYKSLICGSKDIEKYAFSIDILPGMLLCILLIYNALVLPTYIKKGVKKAKENISILIFIIFLALMAVFLFVPPSTLSDLKFIEYLMKHNTILLWIQTLSTIVSVTIFYLSYRYSIKTYTINTNIGWKEE